MATEVMRAAGKRDPARASVSAEAWGLVAARLGSRKNRSEFYSAFWFDEKDPTPNARAEDRTPRMQTRLKRWRDGSEPYKPWAQAREDFAEAWRTVDVLIEQRRRARDRRRRLAELDERERALDASWGEIRGRIQQIDERLADHARNEYELEVERTRAAAERDRQLALRPGVSETLRSLGRATRDWRAELRPLSRRLRETDGRVRDAKAAGQQIRDILEQAQADQSAVTDNLAVIRRDLTELRDECQRDELRYGDGYPGDAWTSERRELHAPWLDAELDTARSELFPAALQLHQDFLANAADKMLPCLRAAVEVVAGRYPRDLEAEKLRAAWQLFFLVVPVVSTTFASMGRMFGGVGCEAIGWLMVDEAGQSSPQCAAGGILRAQRVIAVGDPQQLVPVVTVPQKAERDIASHYGVSETWVPSRASVQSLADRVARFGATLGQGENEVWVSAPLRVHRRCDEPMFSLCNSRVRLFSSDLI